MLQDLGQSRDKWGGGSPRDRVPWKRGRTQELMLMASVLAPTCNLFVPQLPHKKTNNNQVYCRTSLHVVVRIHLLIYVKRSGQHLEWVLLLSKHWGSTWGWVAFGHSSLGFPSVENRVRKGEDAQFQVSLPRARLQHREQSGQ